MMSNFFRAKLKKFLEVCFCSVIICLLVVPKGFGLNFPSVYKKVPSDYVNPVYPNVLLLLDTSGSMLQDMSGSWTYGDGSRMFSSQRYYGRETDYSQNDPSNPYDYYPPVVYLSDSETSHIGSNQKSQMDRKFINGKNRYLYPNDSRLYKLKLVLWNIFTDPSLFQGINVGLATYHQERTYNNGDWYAYYSDSYGSWIRQSISWNGSGRSAVIRCPFGVIDPFSYSREYFKDGVPDDKLNENHWYKMLSLVDGVEKSSPLNDEIRGDGGTPLEDSIYRESEEYTYDPNGDYLYLPPLDVVVPLPRDELWHNYSSRWRYKVQYSSYGVLTIQYYRGGWRPTTYEYDPLSDYRRRLEGNISSNCAASFIKDQIEYTCQQNWLVVLTDGEDSWNRTGPVDAVRSLYRANRRFDWYLSKYGQSPQPVRTFVIGLVDEKLEENREFVKVLDSMAYEGRAWEVISKDEYISPSDVHAFYANDTKSLLDSFRSIFKTIKQANSSSTSAVVVSNELEDSDVFSYRSSFLPKIDGAWPGYLTKKESFKDPVTGKRKIRVVWNASEELDKKNWKSRNIYYIPWWRSSSTSLSGTNLFRFDDSDTSLPSYLGITDGSFNFVNWLRGSLWGTDSPRTGRLFDNYRGDTYKVGPPPGYRLGGSFNEFAFEHRNRKKIVYCQGNDGMLHAFDDEDGEELWAFIPPNIIYPSRILGLKGVEDLNKGSSRYLLAGPLVVEDVEIDGVYRTILVGSLGYGGEGIYCLDVTDPLKPNFLWAFDSSVYSDNSFNSSSKVNIFWDKSGSMTNNAVDFKENHDLSYIRHIIGRPFIGRVKGLDDKDRWIMLVSSGFGTKSSTISGEIFFKYGSLGDLGGKSVYAVSVKDGTLLHRFSKDEMGEVASSVSVPSQKFLDDYLLIEKGYVGDSLGNVWRLNLENNNSSLWSMDKLISFGSSSNPSPIRYPLEMAKFNGQRWIFVGTGNDDNIYSASAERKTINYIAGFKENSDDDLTSLGLEKEDIYEDRDSSRGWRLNIGSDQIVSTAPVISKGFLFIATYKKTGNNPCNLGSAHLYRLRALTTEGQWDDGEKFRSLEGIKVSSMVIKGSKMYLGIMNPAGKTVADFSLPEGSELDSEGALLTIPLAELENDTDVVSDDTKLKPSYWRRF